MGKRVALPRDAVIDRMMVSINGSSAADPYRPGFMSRERANHTIDMFKAVLTNPLKDEDLADSLKKNVSVSTGLTYYDLRAPALNLFPTVTPLRNAIPRAQRQYPGDSARWKAVTNTVGSGFPFMGWVPEGRRSGSMSYTTVNKSLSYMTLGEEDSLTEEARFAAEGFEDEDALVQLRLLLKMFVKEEAAILGGNNSLQLGTPGTVACTASGSGNTLPAGTYSVICVALTQEGFLNASATSAPVTLTINGNDGYTYALSGGSSMKSAATLVTVAAGQQIQAIVPWVRGAVGYAWYAGTSGSETFQTTTTVSKVIFSTTLAAGGQAATAVTADNSTNANYAFDGLLSTGFNSGNNAYVLALNGAGGGQTLTPSGAGGVNEIDTLFETMWNTNLVSPTVIYVNAQELRNITNKVLTNSSAPLLRYNVEADESGMVEYKLTAAGVVSFYFNPYSPDGGVRVPVKIHPNLAPGTILAWAERLPPWYVSNNVPEAAQVLTRQDYYAEVWPKTTRQQYYGVYTQEVLAVYAPFSMGLLTDIANG